MEKRLDGTMEGMKGRRSDGRLKKRQEAKSRYGRMDGEDAGRNHGRRERNGGNKDERWTGEG